MDNFLPGSASLIDMIDKRVLVVLRDGRTLRGWLRSYDQFANLVVQDTYEIATRDADGISFAAPKGVVLVRGENVVVLAEDREQDAEDGLLAATSGKSVSLAGTTVQLVSDSKIRAILSERAGANRLRAAAQRKALHSAGFCVEVQEGDAY